MKNDKKFALSENDLRCAVVKDLYFGLQDQFVTNTYIWNSFETDLARITPAGYIYEFEIKLTQSDLLADMRKMVKHDAIKYASVGSQSCPIKEFWYVLGFEVRKLSDIPDYAGIIIVARDGKGCPKAKISRKAKALKSNKKDKEQIFNIYRKALYKYWSQNFGFFSDKIQEYWHQRIKES